jgi:hypothetical protein
MKLKKYVLLMCFIFTFVMSVNAAQQYGNVFNPAAEDQDMNGYAILNIGSASFLTVIASGNVTVLGRITAKHLLTTSTSYMEQLTVKNLSSSATNYMEWLVVNHLTGNASSYISWLTVDNLTADATSYITWLTINDLTVDNTSYFGNTVTGLYGFNFTTGTVGQYVIIGQFDTVAVDTTTIQSELDTLETQVALDTSTIQSNVDTLQTQVAVDTTTLDSTKVSTSTPDGLMNFQAYASSYVFKSTGTATLTFYNDRNISWPYGQRNHNIVTEWFSGADGTEPRHILMANSYAGGAKSKVPQFDWGFIDSNDVFSLAFYISTTGFCHAYNDRDNSFADGYDEWRNTNYYKAFLNGAYFDFDEDYGDYTFSDGTTGLYFDDDEFDFTISTNGYGASATRDEANNITIFKIGSGDTDKTEDIDFQIHPTSATILHKGVFTLGIDNAGNLTSGGDFDATGYQITATSFHAIATPAVPVAMLVGSGAVGIDYIIRFDGENNDGDILWNEDFAPNGRFEFGCCFKVDSVYTDILYESTASSGVTVDGVLIKDNEVDGVDVSALELAVISSYVACGEIKQIFFGGGATIPDYDPAVIIKEQFLIGGTSVPMYVVEFDSHTLGYAYWEQKMDWHYDEAKDAYFYIEFYSNVTSSSTQFHLDISTNTNISSRTYQRNTLTSVVDGTAYNVIVGTITISSNSAGFLDGQMYGIRLSRDISCADALGWIRVRTIEFRGYKEE